MRLGVCRACVGSGKKVNGQYLCDNGFQVRKQTTRWRNLVPRIIRYETVCVRDVACAIAISDNECRVEISRVKEAHLTYDIFLKNTTVYLNGMFLMISNNGFR